MKLKIAIPSVLLIAGLLSLPMMVMGDTPLVSELFSAASGSDISTLGWSNIGSGQVTVSDVVVDKGNSACKMGNSPALYEKNLTAPKAIGTNELVNLSAVAYVNAPSGCSNRAGVGIKTSAGVYFMDVYKSANGTNKSVWAVWLPGSTSALEFDLPQGNTMDIKVVLTGSQVSFYGRAHGAVYWKLIYQSASGASSVTGVQIKLVDNNPSGSEYPRLDSVYMGHSDDFSKNWVRNHQFQMNTWSQAAAWSIFQNPPEFDRYTAQCSMNSLRTELHAYTPAAIPTIDKFKQNGMVWHAELGATSRTQAMIQTVNGHSTAADDNGWLIKDEPGLSACAGIGLVRDWIKPRRPNALVYANAHPDTVRDEAWMEGYLSQIRPDVLMFDNYPYYDDSIWYEYLRDGIEMYSLVAAYREKAIERRLPLWAFLQAWYGPTMESHRASSFPSGSDLRKQAFVYLASGVKGLCYFIWDSTQDYMYGLINVDGTPTPSRDGSTLFQHAANVNPEIVRLGNYLKHLESTDIRFFAGIPLPPGAPQTYTTSTGQTAYYDNATPPGLINWTAGAGGENRIVSFGVQSPTTRTNGFVGFFEDDAGQKYFMLTNLNSGRTKTPEQTQTTFNIVFDGSVNGVYRLNRLTGQQEWLPTSSGSVAVVLPGGTGDLFTISSAGFDLTAPTGGVSIASGASHTVTADVTLQVSASDDRGPIQMRFSNDNVTWSPWEPYATSKPWTLASGLGVKTVYTQFKDGFGRLSAIVSDTITLVCTISDARKIGSTLPVACVGTVTAVFGDSFYIEDSNRVAGIRVTKSGHGVSIGQGVQVVGAMATLPSTEKYISANTITSAAPSTVKPFGVTNKAIGGTVVTNAAGLDNVGLLVKTTGVVGASGEPNSFNLDDGSGVPLRAYMPNGGTLPAPGKYVSVTGIASCDKVGGVIQRMLQVISYQEVN